MLLGVERQQDGVETPARPLADDVGGCPSVPSKTPGTTPREALSRLSRAAIIWLVMAWRMSVWLGMTDSRIIAGW